MVRTNAVGASARGGLIQAEVSASARGQVDDLFRAHAPRLLRFFRSHTGESEDADDLVQEAFARLSRHQAPSGLQNPEAYLQRIATNLLKDRFRNTKGRPVHIDISECIIPDTSASAESLLEAKDMLDRLEAVLRHLRPKTRTVFLRHRVDGLSYVQIAKETGLSVSGVEKHMMKAIAHIDRHLSRD